MDPPVHRTPSLWLPAQERAPVRHSVKHIGISPIYVDAPRIAGTSRQRHTMPTDACVGGFVEPIIQADRGSPSTGIRYPTTSFSVSIVEHAAGLFRVLIGTQKQAGSMFYFHHLGHN
jgi:hypothetical protein